MVKALLYRWFVPSAWFPICIDSDCDWGLAEVNSARYLGSEEGRRLLASLFEYRYLEVSGTSYQKPIPYMISLIGGISRFESYTMSGIQQIPIALGGQPWVSRPNAHLHDPATSSFHFAPKDYRLQNQQGALFTTLSLTSPVSLQTEL